MVRPLKCVGGGSRTLNLPAKKTRLATMLRPSTNVRLQKYKKNYNGMVIKKIFLRSQRRMGDRRLWSFSGGSARRCRVSE